jgi:hypothetical protein
MALKVEIKNNRLFIKIGLRSGHWYHYYSNSQRQNTSNS